MHGVLRTLAQCHHHKILHRDIKPGWVGGRGGQARRNGEIQIPSNVTESVLLAVQLTPVDTKLLCCFCGSQEFHAA